MEYHIDKQRHDEPIDAYYRRVGKGVNALIEKAILTEISGTNRKRMDSEKLEKAVTVWLKNAGGERFQPWIGGVIGGFLGNGTIRLEKTGIEDYGITPLGFSKLEEINNPKQKEPAQRGPAKTRELEDELARG